MKQWAVVGAGAAGILAVGKLLSEGVAGDEILWCDPHFRVGALGASWSNVMSNTVAQLFTDFLNNITAFNYHSIEESCSLAGCVQTETCRLQEVVTPLQHITDHLQQQVCAVRDVVGSIAHEAGAWTLRGRAQALHAKQVILATGAKAKTLSYPDVETIDLATALDSERMSTKINANDIVAVFGASHSAIMAVRHALEAGAKEVVNFYLHPVKYAMKVDGWVLYNDTGLKGTTAQWSRENITGTVPPKLTRVYASDKNVEDNLSRCTKAVYAIGFEANKIAIENYPEVSYNPHNGIIAPGLFGLGIAYPESYTDPFGNHECRVGLHKFMLYLDKVFPVWQKYVL